MRRTGGAQVGGAQVGRVLREAIGELRAAGIATARQDAELLLSRTLGTGRLALHLDPARLIDPAALARLAAWVRRRVGHEPLQYILGEEEFSGLRLAVGPGVFIPRPETELLVERALAAWPEGTGTAIDLCAGSGAVACALALRRPGLRVWAVELSTGAAGWARRNVAALGLAERVRVVEGDLTAPLAGRGLDGRCDLVTANPPYIATGALPGLPEEVRAFEPVSALDGGPDGLRVVERVLAEGARWLAAGRRLLVEIGHDQAGRVRALLAAAGSWGPPRFHRDLLGYERVLEVERA